MTNDRQRRHGILFALLIIIVAAVVVLTFLIPQKSEKTPVQMTAEDAAGERHQGWTPFYHADSGLWRMLDPESYVLREKKFVSSDREREEYLVRMVPADGVLRILEAQGRWKHVEVLENGEATARGWIDADPIRRVEKLEDLPIDDEN
jgi:hypothetical protein